MQKWSLVLSVLLLVGSVAGCTRVSTPSQPAPSDASQTSPAPDAPDPAKEEENAHTSSQAQDDAPAPSAPTPQDGGPSAPDSLPSGPPAPIAEPQALVVLSTDALQQGDIVTIQVQGSPESSISASSTLGFTPRFFPSEDGTVWTALLPTSYKTQVGTYSLTVTVDGISYDYSLAVDAKDFPVQYLTVDPDTTSATIENDDANRQWNEKIEPLKPVSDPQQYWDGPFLRPVEAPISTEYGAIRYTNGSSSSSNHGGMDFAADQGAQALAANGGRILFADYLQLTGNTVVIEHGYGLKSFYYHMDSLDVEAGQMVEKGDPIGKVGSTGFSTGPHLHYALLVNNVFVDPVPAFEDGVTLPPLSGGKS